MSFLDFLYYRIEDTIIPYNTFSICTYRKVFPPSYQAYLSYTPGNFSRSKFTYCPLIFIIILSPSNTIYVFTNSFGMSSIITSLFFVASITPVEMVVSNAAVRIVTSLQNMYACCELLFAEILDLMV